MSRMNQFIAMSRYAGERFDLVQAGGGNTSVKSDDGSMLIKASGWLLSEVEPGKGYVQVDNRLVLALLEQSGTLPDDRRDRDELVARQIGDAVMASGSLRPSIETLLHSQLRVYTLHSHPLVVNAATCRKDWRDLLGRLFPDALCIEYRTPGIELALEMRQQLALPAGVLPKVLFLQNHGMIVTSDDYAEVEQLTESVVTRLEQYFATDLGRYRMVTTLSRLMSRFNSGPVTVYLSEDAEIATMVRNNRSLLLSAPFCPDTMVFCGAQALELVVPDYAPAVADYCSRFHEPPRTLVVNDRIYFVGRSVKKAKEMEEVFKFHLLVLGLAGADVHFLPEQELAYLGNWEAEKYRRNM